MLKKRLFIAINLPDNIKKKISDLVAGLDARMDRDAAKQIGFRWLDPANWHLTVSFLGYQSDEAVDPILRSVKDLAKKFSTPVIEFEDVVFAPIGKSPRMIWIIGTEKTSDNLADIKDELEVLLIENGVRFKPEMRKYNAHLTLARFADGKSAKNLNIDLSSVSKEIFRSLNFTALSIDLMQSELKRGGVEYFILRKEEFRK